MRLTQGSVVELERLAGEPLDLLVNNTVVAQGEVVLVNDRYGIRLTRVISAEERMKLYNMDNAIIPNMYSLMGSFLVVILLL